MGYKSVEGGELIKYKGDMYKVIGHTEHKTVTLEPVDNDGKIVCPRCGESTGITEQISLVEQSPLFQENAEAIETLKVD